MPQRSVAERPALTRERVVATAMSLADGGGLDSLTMRRLAEELGVEAMSLYYHFPNKNAILDGLLERTFAEIEDESGGFSTEASGDTWQQALRDRILGARRVLLRHPWVPAVMESRSTLVPTMARYIDANVGLMRSGGLSHDLIHHAMHALGSRQYGFSQELTLDGDGSSSPGDQDLARMAEMVPHLAAMLQEVVHDDPESTLGWCDDQTEFEFGLDILLDGLARRHAAEEH
ncbi:TetR/AcrR family transcriptional regulator [Microbacterium sp. CFBP9034]|uniref:TetR/AcrR family transcriptional regulator n=1 Tax=Microbacterium sp. CFBP9034 TaxID=3096540 RepID=UPI002A6AB02C|nr:TetR/AcrR family transcriptional regulator C-terminal domain-containing protein [Microbacterium sp. CFBP9034]MDY0910963.1 TetR/AcrR family transcriptional regulator C-terminal domain-containing protein [Microbacterium sp. CFBP9034]